MNNNGDEKDYCCPARPCRAWVFCSLTLVSVPCECRLTVVARQDKNPAFVCLALFDELRAEFIRALMVLPIVTGVLVRGCSD